MIGLVVKKNADLFTVATPDGEVNVKPRGNLKKEGIFVGDKVEFDKVIQRVCPRKNLLIRPPVANLDKIFIVLASVPQPDFLLVDKLVLCCFVKGIQPYIVVNKEDISDDKFVANVKKTYKCVAKVIATSAVNGKLGNLKKEISGITAFAGQSAVGKSSLINALLGREESKVSGLSKKIERGKQTTRLVRLFEVGKGYIADTAGFSSLDVGLTTHLSPQEVSRYYPDFLPFLANCKYRTCNHKTEGDCGVLQALENGKISQMRYQNYLKIIDLLATFKSKYM